MSNRYGVSFGGGFVYGPQPGMTFGKAPDRYGPWWHYGVKIWPYDPLPARALINAYPASKSKPRK